MTQGTKGRYIALYPDEGKWMTQAELEGEEQRIFSDSVFTRTPARWTEWTAEQKEQWEQQHPSEEQEQE